MEGLLVVWRPVNKIPAGATLEVVNSVDEAAKFPPVKFLKYADLRLPPDN